LVTVSITARTRRRVVDAINHMGLFVNTLSLLCEQFRN
jgi:hypothetical protein